MMRFEYAVLSSDLDYTDDWRHDTFRVSLEFADERIQKMLADGWRIHTANMDVSGAFTSILFEREIHGAQP